MNKLTKVLSVFIIAGAIGTGVAGVAGCKKHQHTYEDTYTSAGADGHYKKANCKHTDEHTEIEPHGTANSEGKCPDCGYQLTNPPTSTGDEVTVSITSTDTEVKVGSSITLIASVTPSGTAVVWSIAEGTEYAEINSSTGELTGKAAGTVKVKATAGGASAEKTITVNALSKY